MATVDENNGFDAQAIAVEERLVTLDFTLAEASALRAWLLKPSGDGSTALDDSLVNSALKKLGGALDRIEAVAAVRQQLEEAGFPTEGMSDEQVAELGRKIGQATQRGLR
jgi:hypothetical protein